MCFVPPATRSRKMQVSALTPSGLFIFLAAVLAINASPDLLQSLDHAQTTEEATAVMQPHMANLKSLEPVVVETIVGRQWWPLARDVIAKSHEQQIDFSSAVRKAVRVLKDEADELLRTLNPKYGLAQQVSPAFQWAQNDTCVFLTIKYTVRWNAPGALEVTEPSVNFTEEMFNFTGLGKHSNNKYRYALSLHVFDKIKGDESIWSEASVGKLSVTLKKRWPRKWPRLLANKKTKISNMHLWMDNQEKLDSALSGMSAVGFSPTVCRMSDKLYCIPTDTCKPQDQCKSCPGKTIPSPEESICGGAPGDKATLSFKDADMEEGQIGGEVKITKARNEYDIDTYSVYYGKDDRTKLEERTSMFSSSPMLVGDATPTGGEVEVKIPMRSKIPDGATHLLVYSRNRHGEFATPGTVLIKDAVIPRDKATSLSFEDKDPDKGEVSGTITIGRASDQHMLEEYSLHWGRSDKKKIASSSHIRDVTKKDDQDPNHYLSSSTKIPDGATHILAFSKNEHGEHPQPASLKIIDNMRPCQKLGDDDCPKSVSVAGEGDQLPNRLKGTVTISRATAETGVTHYSLYWGRADCSQGGQAGAKNGFIRDVLVTDEATFPLPEDIEVPRGTEHLLVFVKNTLAESEVCVSTPIEVKTEETPAAKTEL